MSEQYVPLKEAAEYIGVSRAKLSRLAVGGRITFTTSELDKRLKLFKKADLDAFLKEQPRPIDKSKVA